MIALVVLLLAAPAAAQGVAAPPAVTAPAAAQDLAAPPGVTVPAAAAEPATPAAPGAPTTPAPTRDEDAMFGGGEGSPPAGPDAPTEPVSPSPIATPPGGDGEEAGLSPVRSAEQVQASLEEAYDKLAIGGLLYLRTEYAARDRGSPEDFPLSSPNLFDIYFDARPSDRVRGYIRARTYYDPTIPAEGRTTVFGQEQRQSKVLLDQLWLKFDVLETVYVTAGKQRIKWGAGRFWNPTDFVNQARLDPLAVLDERTGVTLLKLHYPVEALGWNFYAIGTFDEAATPSDVGGALRAELVFGESELGLAAALRKNNPERFGADFTMALWLFDLRSEVAIQHGVTKPFFRGELDLTTEPPTLPEEFSREDDFIPQLVVGADLPIQYSDQDSLTIGAEYFFNDAGYDRAALYPYLLVGGQLPGAAPAGSAPVSYFEPLYMGRHYGAAYLLLSGPGSWNNTTFILSTLGNLSDRSLLTRLDYRVLVLTYLSFDAHAAVHYGANGELRFGPSVALPGGAELSVAPPLLDLGVGLSVSL